jgi:hypothetical protein
MKGFFDTLLALFLIAMMPVLMAAFVLAGTSPLWLLFLIWVTWRH